MIKNPSPKGLGKIVGLDITSPDFWSLVMNQYKAFLDELEKLTNLLLLTYSFEPGCHTNRSNVQYSLKPIRLYRFKAISDD